tara:strand:- start:105060 stop:106184 length:1125 start_codon:yes stop_codon:yes gene_type:complete
MNSSSASSKIKVGVVGARGYSGQELCRLLTQHSGIELAAIFYNEGKPFTLWNQFPEIERLAKALKVAEPKSLDLGSFLASSEKLDVVFLATPNEVSLELAEKFLNRGISVIDLSGIFRLNQVEPGVSQSLYQKFYGIEHSHPKALKQAHYGLHPFNGKTISALKSGAPFLVANPGCYVTSVLMAVIPLLKQGLIDPKSIIVDAKSGASGAGKKANENLLFSELYSDFYPYKVLQHQHVPEMEMYLDVFSEKGSKVVFTPHLLPVFRGILSTCYLKWSPTVQGLSVEEKKARLRKAYLAAYENYPLVEFGDMKEMQKKISVKAIASTSLTAIGYDLDSDNLIVFSALDNLLKGAASQAVENLNCIYGFPQSESLL